MLVRIHLRPLDRISGSTLYTGFYIEDLRTLELAWWEQRQYSAAFGKLTGQEGVCEARVTEIPPGKTLPPLKMAVDEIVYVVEGNGLASVWAGDGPANLRMAEIQHVHVAPPLLEPAQQHAG